MVRDGTFSMDAAPYSPSAARWPPGQGRDRVQRELVMRARAGDHEAFSTLAASSITRLLSTARLILRDEERAQDAVQEALIDAWTDIRGLRDPDRFAAWLHRLLVRHCYRAAAAHRNLRTVE